jgi:hypothetical protein
MLGNRTGGPTATKRIAKPSFGKSRKEGRIRMQFGDKVKDKITGFVGIATARCTYITGSDQVLITPPVKDDGTFQEARWFDVDRVEILT